VKIRQLQVDGFGVWTGLEIGGLSEPLVVLYGENEAGKTTLMQFVRGVLFGFSAERRGRYLPPVGGGRAGGAVVVEDGHHRFVVNRHLARHSHEEQLEVTDGDGTQREGRPLALLLDGVDEQVFNNVFAFGLSEIQELASLSDNAAADLLYELTVGLDRVSLADVVHELESSRRRLLCDADGASQIPQLIEQRENLRAEIRELAAATPHFLELVGQRQELDRSAAELEQADVALDERAQMLGLAQLVEPRWRSRQEIERKITALGTVPHIADDCLPQLDDLKARLATRRQRLQRATQRRTELVAEAGRLKINDALCRQAPRLEALAEQQHWIASLGSQAEQIEAELNEMTGEHKPVTQHKHPEEPPAKSHERSHAPPGKHGHSHTPSHAPSHGHSPTHSHTQSQAHSAPPAKPLSSATVAGLRKQGKALAQMRRKLRKIDAEMASARDSAQGLKKQVQAAGTDGKQESLVKSVERAGTLVSQLRRRVQIDERLDQLERRRKDVEQKVHDALDQQVPSTAQVFRQGIFVWVGAALVFASFVSMMLPVPLFHGHYGMFVGFFGLAIAGAGAVMTYAASHMSSQQLEDSEKQFDQLKSQISATENERDDLDKQLPKGGGPLVSRLQTAEKELARLEELLPHDSQRQHAVRTYKSSKGDRRSAIRDYKKARERWRQSLTQAGLPGDLSPRALKETLEHGRQQQALHRRLEERRAQLTDFRRQHEILADRIRQVADDARIETAEPDPLALLRELLRLLQDEQLRVQTRDQLRAHLVRLRRVRRKVVRQVSAVNQRLADLIRSSGARDEEDLRRRADTVAEARRLEREHEAHNDEIAAALAGRGDAGQVTLSLDAGHDLRQLLEEVAADKHTQRTKLGAVWQQRGAVLEQIKSQAQDRRLGEKHLALSSVREKLRHALHRWQVLSTCSLALDSVREVYERDRQPEVLREASGYFSQLTGGRYTRAWTSLGHRSLWVDDAAGQPLPVDKLSRGTREQLFLSLRLALVSAYARRGVRLPVVMDDVLVNFDVGRVKSAVAVLRDFAKAGHQILVFTCHEHIVRLFRNAQVEVRTLPGNTLRYDDVPPPEPVPAVVPPPHFLPEPKPQPPLEQELGLADVEEAAPPPAPKAEPLLELEPLPELETLPMVTIVHPTLVARPPAPVRAPRIAKPRRTRLVAEPAPRAQAKRKVREEQWVDRVPWSAEEFDGELSDRVRRSEPIVEYVEQSEPAISAASHEEELFEVQFEEERNGALRNGRRAR
jgi:uncharacterized protein YhaN